MYEHVKFISMAFCIIVSTKNKSFQFCYKSKYKIFVKKRVNALFSHSSAYYIIMSTHYNKPCISTRGAKSLYLAKKRLEVTSPAIVVLNAFLDSSDLPKEGLSGLLWKFFWRDALIRRYLDLLFVIYS